MISWISKAFEATVQKLCNYCATKEIKKDKKNG